MTVRQFAESINAKALAFPNPEREIGGAYIGDLLSWVMGRAEAEDVWITIMSNVNVLAVASLADVACVLLAEGVSMDDELLTTANEKGVNVLSTELSAYGAAVKLSALL